MTLLCCTELVPGCLIISMTSVIYQSVPRSSVNTLMCTLFMCSGVTLLVRTVYWQPSCGGIAVHYFRRRVHLLDVVAMMVCLHRMDTLNGQCRWNRRVFYWHQFFRSSMGSSSNGPTDGMLATAMGLCVDYFYTSVSWHSNGDQCIDWVNLILLAMNAYFYQ